MAASGWTRSSSVPAKPTFPLPMDSFLASWRRLKGVPQAACHQAQTCTIRRTHVRFLRFLTSVGGRTVDLSASHSDDSSLKSSRGSSAIPRRWSFLSKATTVRIVKSVATGIVTTTNSARLKSIAKQASVGTKSQNTVLAKFAAVRWLR